MKDSPVFNSSANSSSRLPENMVEIQGRTFGPLMGLFLVNLFAKVVAAKYESYFPFHLTYDPSPWLPSYNKPLANYNYHSYYPHWYPVKNPYNHAPPSYQTYPTLTTAAPFVSSEQLPAGYDNDYREDYTYPTQDPNNYENLIPAESNNVHKESKETTTVVPEISTVVIETTSVATQEPETAESNRKTNRKPTQRSRRRGPIRRNKYPQRRRRTTTPPPEYYHSYEDYTERYQPNRRRRPQINRHSSEQYYDDDDEYYDSFETTTRFFKRPRRPTRRVTKVPTRNDVSLEIETSTEKINPNTEIVIVRQASTTTITTSTTTTEPSTIITNSTMPSPTTEATNTTYGYGPSNGNTDHVSFTYGPPVGPNGPNKYQYQVPFFDWYTHEATKNAIVKRVRDIVNTT